MFRKMAQTLSMSLSQTTPITAPARSMLHPLSNNLFPALSAAPPTFLGQSIRSIKVKTFEIPDNKRLAIGLQKIHGIGRLKAHQVLCELCIENKPAKDLTALERYTLGEEIYAHLIDRDLRQFNKNAIKRVCQIQCYRGTRHVKKLPCRGQRTHTNASTVKRGTNVAVPGKEATK